ncbi:nuclear envelope pore membrane protein POM 121-like [Manis pentadactyla]|uniref:nuclear envelope pore membrane protein POM 121-like n=1 Tax=Manis pentadactyla TaxID=143292 RepID=UPI00255C88E7|nr:nuclear envelope pore membrane protein POM 121-like [Manis pentadactyla]
MVKEMDIKIQESKRVPKKGLWDFTTPLWHDTSKMIPNPVGPAFPCVSTLCRNGSHRKRVLSRGNSRVVCRPLTIHNAPDPWSKEAVLLALEHWKRKKRTVEEEEDQTSAAGQEDKRRCQDSRGSGHSAFKPEVANGVPAAFVPEPGPLKRGLSSQSSDGELRKRTCTSAVSCSKGTCTCGIRMSSCNAITSSYASTGGISQLWKRRPSASPFSSPALSRSQTPERPEKKIREEDGPQGSGSSAPPVDKESQGEQDTTTCREQNSWDSPATPSSSQPRRRKFPLVPSRRRIPLILPPAPWIGHSITVKEYYQEKQAQSQWLKRIFEDKTTITSGFGAMTQITSCGPNTSVFGSTISSPFTSRMSAGPTGSGGFGMSMAAPHSCSTTGAFGFGARRSGRTGLKNHFWGGLDPNSLGAAGQSTPSPFLMASMPQNTYAIAATTSGFGAMTQTTSSRTSSSVFGSTTSSPFMS